MDEIANAAALPAKQGRSRRIRLPRLRRRLLSKQWDNESVVIAGSFAVCCSSPQRSTT